MLLCITGISYYEYRINIDKNFTEHTSSSNPNHKADKSPSTQKWQVGPTIILSRQDVSSLTHASGPLPHFYQNLH